MGKQVEYAQASFSSFYLSAYSIGRRDCVIDRSLILGTIGGQYVSVQRQGFSVNEVSGTFGSLEEEKSHAQEWMQVKADESQHRITRSQL